MTLKKSKHILSLAISRNEMNEKADFEVILKRWEHVAYVRNSKNNQYDNNQYDN